MVLGTNARAKGDEPAAVYPLVALIDHRRLIACSEVDERCVVGADYPIREDHDCFSIPVHRLLEGWLEIFYQADVHWKRLNIEVGCGHPCPFPLPISQWNGWIPDNGEAGQRGD